MPTMMRVNGYDIPIYTDEESAAILAEGERQLAKATQEAADAKRAYARTIVMLEARHAWALVSCVLGSAIIIAVGVMILYGADFNPRRVAAALAVGWLVLVPWSFLPAINPPWRRK